MTQRVGAKGQVVIPKSIRDELGLRPGVEVEFERDGDAVRVSPAAVTAAARDATLLTGDPDILQRDLGCRTRNLRPT